MIDWDDPLVRMLLEFANRRLTADKIAALTDSYESAMQLIRDRDPCARMCAINSCVHIWKRGNDPSLIDLILSLIQTEENRAVLLTAIGFAHLNLRSTKHLQACEVLARFAIDIDKSYYLRGKAYAALWAVYHEGADAMAMESFAIDLDVYESEKEQRGNELLNSLNWEFANNMVQK